MGCPRDESHTDLMGHALDECPIVLALTVALGRDPAPRDIHHASSEINEAGCLDTYFNCGEAQWDEARTACTPPHPTPPRFPLLPAKQKEPGASIYGWMEHALPSLGPSVFASVLRVRTSNFAFVLHYFFPRIEYYLPERIRNIRIKFQMSPNCHFDSLNLVRNSNLEFEFMHKIRATERA